MSLFSLLNMICEVVRGVVKGFGGMFDVDVHHLGGGLMKDVEAEYPKLVSAKSYRS
jgi:hypothetical protein